MPTVLLCHCDGTNGSTTFTDVSASAHTLAVVNTAAVSTAQVKFGTGSLSATGAGYVSVGGTTDFDFGSGQFTLEAWVYITSGSASGAILARWGNVFTFGISSGFTRFTYKHSGTNVDYFQTPAVGINAWHHLAADRDAGNTLRLYIDGVIVTPVITSSTSVDVTADTLFIGNDATLAHPFPGYIDEVRVTKGTALYAGAFTPPTGPFANGGAAAAQARAMVLA